MVERRAEVSCGEDFCHHCGDCLACYGDDPCTHEGTHDWPMEEVPDEDKASDPTTSG